MFLQQLFLLIFAIVATGIKVNMEGKLTLGKEVMETLAHYIAISPTNGRRSLNSVTEEDPITNIIRSEILCHDIIFCKHLKKFVEEYVIVQSKTLENIISRSLGSSYYPKIYKTQLKHTVDDLKEIFITANSNFSEDNENIIWIDTLKKISFQYQQLGSIFANEINIKVTDELGLFQKIIIATVVIEAKYTNILCTEHKYCSKSYLITNSLNSVLSQLVEMAEDKNREFVKEFYEALSVTSLYSHLEGATAHQLQVILNDMALSPQVPTKKLITSVHKVVESRLELLSLNKVEKLSHDVYLVHAILSDMDHLFGGNTFKPVSDFLAKFVIWTGDGMPLNRHMHQFFMDITKVLADVSDDLFDKLLNEVKVFLELTIVT